MQCNLVQNAVQFGAKHSAIWCKIQCNLLQNAVRFAAKCRAKRIIMRWVLRLNVFLLDRKLGLNMSKSSFKRAFFDPNSWFLPMIFLRVGHQLER